MRLRLPLIKSKKVLIYSTLSIFFLIFFILFFLQPFDNIIHGYTVIGFLRTLSYAFTASMVFFLCESYLRDVVRKNKTGYFPMLWYLIELLIIATAIFLCKEAWSGFKEFYFSMYLLMLYRVTIIGLIPILLLMVINYAYEKRAVANTKILLKSNDVNPEYLSLLLNNVLYLTSEDNYTILFYQNKQEIQKKILRGSLSFFEKQVTIPLMRVHRSHIVNLLSIEKVDINSQGGELTFTNQIVLKISRKYITAFKEHWQLMNQPA